MLETRGLFGRREGGLNNNSIYLYTIKKYSRAHFVVVPKLKTLSKSLKQSITLFTTKFKALKYLLKPGYATICPGMLIFGR